MTPTKRKLKRAFAKLQHGNTASGFRRAKRGFFSKRLGRLLGKHYFYKNESQVQTCGVGVQKYADLPSAFAYAEISQLFTDATEQLNIANSAYTIPTATMSIYLKSCYLEYEIKNEQSIQCRMEIFDFMCRRDNNLSPSGLVISGTSDETKYTQPQTAVPNQETVVGHNPFMARQLGQYFHCFKTTTCVIEPGAIHIHRVRLDPNAYIPFYRITGMSETDFKGLTYRCMVRFNGAVVGDSVNPGTAATTGPIKLAIVCKKAYTTQLVSPSNFFLTAGNQLGTATVTTDMNEETDQPSTIQAGY